MAGRYMTRFECAQPGCGEWTHFTAHTRKEQAEDQRRYYGKWKCIRHDRPQDLLTPTSRKLITELVSDERPHGVYWGHFGFVSGPGFRAFAKDFPAGTTLRVIAEVVLPEPAAQPTPHQDQKL